VRAVYYSIGIIKRERAVDGRGKNTFHKMSVGHTVYPRTTQLLFRVTRACAGYGNALLTTFIRPNCLLRLPTIITVSHSRYSESVESLCFVCFSIFSVSFYLKHVLLHLLVNFIHQVNWQQTRKKINTIYTKKDRYSDTSPHGVALAPAEISFAMPISLQCFLKHSRGKTNNFDFSC